MARDYSVLLQSLKTVAARRRARNPQQPYNTAFSTPGPLQPAGPLARAIRAESTAARDGQSDTARTRFRGMFNHDVGLNFNNMNNHELETMLAKYFSFLDEMFFFNLLNDTSAEGPIQPMRGASMPIQRRALVTLKFKHGKLRNRTAHFLADDDSITISTINPATNRVHRLEELIDSLLHEMIHAFFAIFADDNNVKHPQWVTNEKGHVAGESYS
ncbi:hypothetical protein F5Y15DRAFT_416077 [Xylariaceae sp. FL0016]|nr:hypothetical protein F5Y15DRAFT_416077 [Xylariaceae sp. FL0016]